MNPYVPAITCALPPNAEPHRATKLSRKYIAWNAVLTLAALIVYVDLYAPIKSELMRVLTRLFSGRFDDIYAMSEAANLATFFTPAIALLSLSTLFFVKAGPVRFLLVLPVFPFLIDRIIQQNGDLIFLLLYIVIIVPILTIGHGWPIVIRRLYDRRGSLAANAE